MELEDLSGKVAVVTGGSRGIGRHIAQGLIQAGATVAITGRNRETLETTASEFGEACHAFDCDQRDPVAIIAMSKSVTERLGVPDILVNNAGITRDNLLLRMSEEDWDAVIATNLKSAFNLCKAVYRPMMKQRGGKIINVSSVVGTSGNAGQVNYAASKAGLIGFSKSLAKELASRGVCVNVLSPGYVATDMTEGLPDAAKQAMLATVPLKRAAEPGEIADAALFLASSESDYITGHVLHVNGGMLM